MGVSTTRGMATGKGLATMPFRSMARHPKASATLGGVLVVASLWAWWALQLWGLPDVGDPFDVAAFEHFHVPADRNAFLDYRVAASMMTPIRLKFQASKADVWVERFPASWSEANPDCRDMLGQSAGALAAWRAGSERPDALYEHAEGLSFRTPLNVTPELRWLARLAILEGSRLEAEGDVAGAWGWHRAALRSSRHSGRHGFQVERLVGAAIHDDASKALTRWAAHPKVDAPLLRRALDEVIAIDAMTVPRSETLKLEYLLFVHALDDPNLIEDLLVSKILPDDAPDWCQDLPVSDATKKPIQAVRVAISSDRQRSLRLARLMTANWLPRVDKLPSRRTRLARQDPPIYEADPAGPPSSRALPPEKLSKWLDSSLLASRYFRALYKSTPAIDRERTRQARLVVHLASELYRREHDGPPPSPQALVGPYLKALPEGFDAVDEPVEAGR